MPEILSLDEKKIWVQHINENIQILLGSKSPRRRELLAGAGFSFRLVDIDIDEDFSGSLPVEEVAAWLSDKKALAWKEELKANEVLLTADTIVICDGAIMGKPKDEEEAFRMLRHLSGKEHRVITGFCLRSRERKMVRQARTKVRFKHLDDDEISYYITNYQPFDKAGAYGIQEWIGHIGIDHIEGSFYNVMGLPVSLVYRVLKENFLQKNR